MAQNIHTMAHNVILYGTQCHIILHFLLGKIRNGLIYIIFTLEQEMHSLGKDWVFSAYSARDDDVYHQYLVEIDEFRIKVTYRSLFLGF